MNRSISLLSIFVFLGLFLDAQVKLKGLLQNEEGIPLAFANIVVNDPDSNFVNGFIAEEDGSFDLSLKTGKYLVVFSYIGLQDQSFDIDQSYEFGKIILEKSATELQDVTVTASRPAVQRMQDRLIVNVENSVLSSGNNTLEVLQRSPGIIVDQDGNISMGGRTGVRVYIDGKDTRLGGDQLASILEGMPASSIEKIEIITNPSAKYEAQGNAGIIDIITKKGKLFGYNGSLSLSPGMGRHLRWENNLNFNYRREKLNLYGQYSFAKRNQYMEILIERAFLKDGIPQSDIDMATLFRLPIETHSPRIGLDYFVSDQTTIGVLLTSFANLTGQDADNVIATRNNMGQLIGGQETAMNTSTNWYQYTGNLNIKHNFSGNSNLDIDFDYARYDNNSDQFFDSEFTDQTGSILLQNALIGRVDGYLDLKGLTIDFSQKIGDGNAFEAGWKNTIVGTDNDLVYLDEEEGVRTLNTNLSNRFIYDEKIYAAYANFRFTSGKLNGNLGIRAEQTNIKGQQVTTDENFDNDYLNLFPSFSVNYEINKDYTVGLSGSRRLDRPGYNDLNPFRFFVNNYTYRVGNPTLTPQFTWGAEANLTLKQRYYFAFSYGLIRDNLTRAILQDGDREEVIVTPLNIDDLKSFGFTASFPINFSGKWTSQWNINASINDFKGVVGGFNFERVNRILVINTNHNFELGRGFRLQVGGFYLPAHYASISRINDISNVTLGLQKSILNNKGSLRFNVNDVFYQGYPTGRTTYGNLDDIFISKRDSRYATLTFNFRFGKQTVKSQRRRQSGIQDEMDRARQENG